MVDTARTRAYLVATSLPDNVNRDISEQDLRDFLLSVKHMTTGAGAPSSTPEREGDGYYDSTNDHYYAAFGTSTSADWKRIYPPLAEINAQVGTTYTLVLGDAGKVITSSNASAQTLTIPTNASVAFPVGTVISVIQIGAGVLSIAGDTGVTLNGVSAGSGDINTQYMGVTLTKLATDTWIASGDIGTVA